MSRLTDEELQDASGGGIIGLFTRHRTAANLLMVVMIVIGVFSLSQLNRQFFPDFGIDQITISVAWPGASADDVDGNIIQAIEPEVRFIDGVDEVTSASYEGIGVITVAFDTGSDMQKGLSEIESAVAQVSTLPEDSEDVKVRRIVRYDDVVRLVLSGPYSEESLKAVAKRIRDDLLARGIDKVDLTGVRDEEIWVEVKPETLRRLDLTLQDAAVAIRQSNRDVPAGTLAGGERQIRSLGLQQSAERLAEVEVKALRDGTKLYLGDIANVIDTFEEGGITMSRRGNRAIELKIQRALGADMLVVSDTVRQYLAEIGPTLPPSLKIEPYENRANLVRDRIRVLLENGASGLLLVLLILFLFLSARIAFWVAVGIPVSLFATMAVMLATGQSINMLSLFGLIMAIGIVVDDAIVVGEHADARFDNGESPLNAATGGALRMAAPVTSSTLTTIAAFMPLFVIGGIIGEIISAIPFVVVAILIASLIECFLVLPTHMHGALSKKRKSTGGFRNWFDRGFKAFRDSFFRGLVKFAIRWRYVTVAIAASAFLLAIGLVAGERVKFLFFPTPETNTVFVNIEMVAGTSREETLAAMDTVERALYRTATKLTRDKTFVVLDEDESSLFRLPSFLQGEGKKISREMVAEDLVPMSVGLMGRFFTRGPGGNSSGSSDTQAGIRIELLASDRRDIRTGDFIKAWRAEVPQIPNVKTLAIRPQRGGPPGRDLDIRLAGGDTETLKLASEELRQLLADFPGVSDVEDDLPYGKPETILEVSGRGRSLGFTTQSVADQVRGALQGTIAQRFARNDEEVTVRVQYPRDAVEAGVLETLYLRSPTGGQVPLNEITARRDDVGFSRIKRVDGVREVAITAELDSTQTSTAALETALTTGNSPAAREVAERHGLRYEFKGRSEEQAETFSDMINGAILGLIGIYIILAWVFGSYFRPIAVMLTIPLGAIGTFAGHYLLGYDITILSMIALIGLSGIVINDSIVLITTIDERQKTQGYLDAVIDGACDRFRAVLLTSMTTIGGLTPLIFETSLQAQFLIPMAITIVFGLAVATLLILLVVPSLVAIQGDIGLVMNQVMKIVGGRKNGTEVINQNTFA